MELYNFSKDIERFLGGDTASFETIFNEASPFIDRICWKYFNSDADRADAAQESFLKIYQNLPKLEDTAAFVKWASMIARSTCLDIIKHKKAKESKDDLMPTLSTDDEQGIDSIDRASDYSIETNPAEIYNEYENRQILQAILRQVPELQRSCLILWTEEYTYREIAEMLDIPEGTAKSNVNYAKKKVAKAVNSYEQEHGVKLYSSLAPVPFILLALRNLDLRTPLCRYQAVEQYIGENAGAGPGSSGAADGGAGNTPSEPFSGKGIPPIAPPVKPGEFPGIDPLQPWDAAGTPEGSGQAAFSPGAGSAAAAAKGGAAAVQIAGMSISIRTIIITVIAIIAVIGGIAAVSRSNRDTEEEAQTSTETESVISEEDNTAAEEESVQQEETVSENEQSAENQAVETDTQAVSESTEETTEESTEEVDPEAAKREAFYAGLSAKEIEDNVLAPLQACLDGNDGSLFRAGFSSYRREDISDDTFWTIMASLSYRKGEQVDEGHFAADEATVENWAYAVSSNFEMPLPSVDNDYFNWNCEKLSDGRILFPVGDGYIYITSVSITGRSPEYLEVSIHCDGEEGEQDFIAVLVPNSHLDIDNIDNGQQFYYRVDSIRDISYAYDSTIILQSEGAEQTEISESSAEQEPQSGNWQQAYYDTLIANHSAFQTTFALIYVDEDDIPELIVGYNGTSHYEGVDVYTFYNGNVCYLGEIGTYTSFMYREKKNQIVPEYEGVLYVSRISNGQLQAVNGIDTESLIDEDMRRTPEMMFDEGSIFRTNSQDMDLLLTDPAAVTVSIPLGYN